MKQKKITHSLYENLTFVVDNIIESKINKKFNIIIAKNIIHFTEKKINIAFNNIYKLLKKNGIIIISEPIIKPDGWIDDTLNKKSDKFDKSIW